MGAARKVSPAPWTRPGAPRVSGRPSWIGIPRVSAAAIAPVRAPSVPPPSEGRPVSASVRPPSIAPSLVPITRPSVPAPSPLIQSTRELELESEVAALRQEVARLAAELSSVRSRVLEESEPEIVRLAITVAERVVGRELASDPSLVLDWIRQGLTALPGREEIVVAVATDIAAHLPLEVIADAAAGRRVIVDASLRPGSCEVREGASCVPAGHQDRLAAITDALGMDTEHG